MTDFVIIFYRIIFYSDPIQLLFLIYATKHATNGYNSMLNLISKEMKGPYGACK
jgi:hypothetical protein